MKKLFILLLLSSAAFSQNVAKKETINKFLLKTWKADYAMLNGLKVEKMGKMQSLEYTFKADGTFIGNKTASGTWKYNARQKSIELYQDAALKSTITSLQANKFIMVLNIDEATPTPKGVKTLQIYFKPKA